MACAGRGRRATPGPSCGPPSTPASAARTRAPAARGGSSAAPAGRRARSIVVATIDDGSAIASATSRSVIGADGWSFNPSPTPGVSTPLRSRIAGLWIAPALITTRSAARSAPSVGLDPDRPAVVEHDPVDVDVTHDLEVRPGADRVEVRLDHRDPPPVTKGERDRPGVGVGGDERSVDGAPLVLRDQFGGDQVIGEERTAGQRDHGVHGAGTTHPPAGQVAASAADPSTRTAVRSRWVRSGSARSSKKLLPSPARAPSTALADIGVIGGQFGAPGPIPATSRRSTDRRSDGRRARIRPNRRRRSSTVVTGFGHRSPCHDDGASSAARWA